MPSIEISGRTLRLLNEYREKLQKAKPDRTDITLDDAIEFLRWNYEQKKYVQVPSHLNWGRF